MSRELIEDNFKKLTKAVNENDIEGAVGPVKVLMSKKGCLSPREKEKFFTLLASWLCK